MARAPTETSAHFGVCWRHPAERAEPLPGASDSLTVKSRLFPMWVISVDNFLELDELRPHQELLAAGKLCEYERGTGFVTFVSHQWSSSSHPDPSRIQLLSLQTALRNMRSGRMQLSQDGVAFVRGNLKRRMCPDDLKAVASGWLWIDYSSIPQVGLHSLGLDRSQLDGEFTNAVMSLHTYVADSSFFVILAPCQHHEKGHLMSYGSWKSRGWCQFELAVNILLGTKPVLLISSETAVKHLCFRMFYHLAPCCAEFTKESDRHHIAAAMQQVVEIQAEEHRISGRSHESQMLECLRSKLLRFPTGSSDPSCQAPGLRRVARTRSFLNLTDSHNGWTDLHYAVARSSEEIVAKLLAMRADIHAQTRSPEVDFFLRGGLTPLHIWTCFSTSVPIAELLIGAQADVNFPAQRRWTPLMVACEVGNELVVRTLLRLRADPNGQTRLSTRPLSVAVCYDFPSLVDPLLEARADPFYEWAGIGTLHQLGAAGSGGSLHRLLREGLDLNSRAYFNLSSKAGVAHFLYRLWDRDIHRDYQLMQGGTPLVFAAARGNCEALQALLEAQANIHIPNAWGKTAYQISAQTGVPDEVLRLLRSPAEAAA